MSEYSLDLRHTAIHDAGHAVPHERLRILQTHATIKPNNELAGSVTAEGENHVWSKDEAEPMVLAFCAGYAALVATGIDDQTARMGADGDFEKAVRLIDDWGLDGGLEDWLQRAVAMFSEPKTSLPLIVSRASFRPAKR